jgi:hypothetical protein
MLSQRPVAFAVFAGLALAACGGSAFSADDDGAGPGPDGGAPPSMDATAPTDGAEPLPDVTAPEDTGTPAIDTGPPTTPDAAGPIPCPAAQPTAQTSCAPEGRVCEYGTSPVEECDTLATCTNGAWSIMMSNASGKDCPNSKNSICPATEDGITRGDTCDQSGAICDYTRGRCDCAQSGSGVVVITLDGGPLTPTWHCQNPAPACPLPRPNLGTACPTDQTSCDYGSCNEIIGGTAEICRDGVWQSENVACPL